MGDIPASRNDRMKTFLATFLLLFSVLLLGACKNADWADMSESEDIPDGPGIFTGEEGEVVIYRK